MSWHLPVANMIDINAPRFVVERTLTKTDTYPYDKSYLVFPYASSGFLYSSESIYGTYSIVGDSITWTNTEAGYGLGFIVPCKPNTTYNVSVASIDSGAQCRIAYYSKGLWQSYETKYDFATTREAIFTTQDNTDMVIVLFRASAVGTCTCSGIKLHGPDEVVKLSLNAENQIPISTDASGAIYSEKGWKDSVHLTDSGAESYDYYAKATGFIPCRYGDTLGCSGIQYNQSMNSTYFYLHKIVLYDENKGFLTTLQPSTIVAKGFTPIYGDDDNLSQLHIYSTNEYWATIVAPTAYIRVESMVINDSSRITVNEKEVVKVSLNGKVLWQKVDEEQSAFATALVNDGTAYPDYENGLKG